MLIHLFSQRSINGKGKLGGGMTRLKKQSRRSENVSRGTDEGGRRCEAAYNKAKLWQSGWSGRPSLWLREKFSNIAPNNTRIFKLAKQIDKTNQDVVGEKCVRNGAGELSLSVQEKMKAWVEHYARLLNVEFEWESDLLPEVAPVEGPPPPVKKDLIPKAIRKMKCGKAAGGYHCRDAESCW